MSERREEILRRVSGLLREKGLALSLQEIAADIGTTYNALYHHFASRDDLILQCLLRGMSVIEEALAEAAAAGGTGREQVARFLDLFLRAAIEAVTPPGHLGIGLGAAAQRTLARRARPVRDELVAMIERGVADGTVAPCDPLVAAAWIEHTLFWMPEELYRVREPEDVCRGVFALIDRGLAGANPSGVPSRPTRARRGDRRPRRARRPSC